MTFTEGSTEDQPLTASEGLQALLSKFEPPRGKFAIQYALAYQTRLEPICQACSSRGPPNSSAHEYYRASLLSPNRRKGPVNASLLRSSTKSPMDGGDRKQSRRRQARLLQDDEQDRKPTGKSARLVHWRRKLLQGCAGSHGGRGSLRGWSRRIRRRSCCSGGHPRICYCFNIRSWGGIWGQ